MATRQDLIDALAKTAADFKTVTTFLSENQVQDSDIQAVNDLDTAIKNFAPAAFPVLPPTAGIPASITVEPASTTLTPGSPQQFTAVAHDPSGNVLATQPTFEWSASSGAIDAQGNFTDPNAVSGQTVTVTATSGGVSGEATVTYA